MASPADGPRPYVSAFMNPSKYCDHWNTNDKEPWALRQLDRVNGFIGIGYGITLFSMSLGFLRYGLAYAIVKGSGKLLGMNADTTRAVGGMKAVALITGVGTGVFLGVSLINLVAHSLFASKTEKKS